MTDAPRTTPRLQTIEMIIARGTNDPFPYYARGMELRALGRLEDAVRAFAELRERLPTYVPTYLMAAQTCVELGERAAARRWCEDGMGVASAAGDDKAHGELGSLLATLS